MRPFLRSGDPFVWLAGSALALCLVMITGLVAIVLYNGLGHFWPADLVELELRDGNRTLGELVNRQSIPGSPTEAHRVQMKVGNRDAYGLDFRWIDEAEIDSRRHPPQAVTVERLEWGNMYGTPTGIHEGDSLVTPWDDGAVAVLESEMERVAELAERMRELAQGPISGVDADLEELRLEQRRLEREGAEVAANAALEERRRLLWRRYEELTDQLSRWREQSERYELAVRVEGDGVRRVDVADIVRIYWPNQMGTGEKALLYAGKVWEFLSGSPRESNTEGGIFPALFGTVMMVILMTIAVVPFGVLAALYLREYARQGVLVRTIRIAVNNLAGVPSIVFGRFGLGFFVYGIGGTIDQLFYQDSLPTPTFGTGGILWAALTLALLTLPVVIVATEEALTAVPAEVRDGSLALGSTKLQMIWRVVLPSALPGILTGVILATARGAGEVAPLMITGVVKLAPDLAMDAVWPFLHLERKFMHLGFHIYDVGFQSPNVEAARPMVYATTLLLLVVVLVLNLTAIVVRNRLRKRFAYSTF